MPNEEIIPFEPSSLETIDTAVYKFVNETINAHTLSNNGWKKVPVLWLGTERAYQVKNNKELRDSVGKLKLPLITVTRTNVVRDEWKGSYQSYYPTEKGYQGGATYLTKVLSQKKTSAFASTRMNKKIKGHQTGKVKENEIVYETITIPKPTYVTCMFEVHIRTEYQQQMNDLIPPFIVDQKNVYPIDCNNHKYELFIQDDYGLNNNLANLSTEERMFTAKVTFKVLGYLVGDGPNRIRPQVTRKQNIVRVVVSRERSMVGDNNNNAKDSLAGLGTFEGEVELSGSEGVTAVTKTTGEFREF